MVAAIIQTLYLMHSLTKKRSLKIVFNLMVWCKKRSPSHYIRQERSKFDIEYLLRGIDKPVGLAGYELMKNIPEKLKDSLPALK